jgi:PAS domain S-box-containing protein
MRVLTRSALSFIARLRRWVAPRPSSNPMRSLTGSLVNAILLTTVGLWLSALALLVVSGAYHPPNVLLGLGAVVALSALWVLSRRGRPELALLLAFGASWVVTTLQIYNVGTLTGIYPSGYLILVMLAGLVFGGRMAAAVCLLGVAALTALGWAETSGLLPPAAVPSRLNTLLNFAAVLAYAAALMTLTRSSLLNAWRERLRAETALRELNQTLEQRVAERTEALKISQERYLTLMMMSPDGISVADASGSILACNEQFAHIHGFESSNDVIGRNAAEFTGEEEYERLRGEVAAVFRSGESIARGIEVPVQGADGKRLVTEYSVAPLKWHDAPSGVAFVSSARDITKQKELMAALERHRVGLEEVVAQRTADLKAEVDVRMRIQGVLRDRILELSSLQALGKVVSFSLHFDEIINTYLNRMVTVAHADFGEVFLIREKELKRAAADGQLKTQVDQLGQVELAKRLCEQALADQQVIYLPEIGDSPYCRCIDEQDLGLHSVVVLPLKGAEKNIGAIALWAAASGAFASGLSFLEASADMVSARLHNALLHHEMQERAAGLEETVAERTRELQTERDRTQAILDTVGESVLVTDNDGQVLFTNPATLILTGYSRDEILGQPLWFKWSAESLAETWPEAQRAVSSGEAWYGEITGRRRDGGLYTAALTGTALYDANGGEPVGSVWVQRDITPLKEAERLKDKFVSNVSHELRTPISIIALSCDNLQAFHEKLDEVQRFQMIQDIHEQAHLLNNLTEDILKITQIDGGVVSGARTNVDLARLIRDEVESQQPVAGQRSQRLSVRGEGPLVVDGNETQLRQVVRNLLDNAIKYTPIGGSIVCQYELQVGSATASPMDEGRVKRWAAVEISDNGIGIPGEELPFIFERFYRVHGEVETPGSGLGLSIAQELIVLHGGWIAAASTLGEGSTFTIYLPCSEAETSQEQRLLGTQGGIE